jgi:hypothetical protein
MKARALLVLVSGLSLAACLDQKASAASITTLYESNNVGSLGGAVYFDVNIANPGGLRFTTVDTNVTNSSSGVSGGLQLYTTSIGGTSVGNQTNPGAWILRSSGTGIGAGQDNPTAVDISDFRLKQGQYGFALVLTNWANRYTNGTGTNQFFSNADLALTFGSASNAPFTGEVFIPRVWNGTLNYQTVPGPLPVLGLAAAFGYSRRLRRRLKRD